MKFPKSYQFRIMVLEKNVYLISKFGFPLFSPFFEVLSTVKTINGYIDFLVDLFATDDVQGSFYRSGGGAEIDLLLSWPNGNLWAIEIKRSMTPKLDRGFHSTCADLNPYRKIVVYPGKERYRLAADIEAMPLQDITQQLFDLAKEI